MRPSLRDHRRAKVLVFDGATGTSLQGFRLTPDDFHGHAGCLEYLVLSRPDVVRAVHASYYDVGCEVVETDTLGANAVALEEFGLADRSFDINRAAARLAREVAADYESAGRPRYVSGSIGPGTKLPSLGQIPYRELREAYRVQALGLIEGGAHLFQIETCQDILQVKAALAGVRQALRERGADLPVIVQVTIQPNGRMLLGTDIGAALTACEPFSLFAFGLNCGTGPQAMTEPLRFLGGASPFPIAVMPNAGLPVLRDGATEYDLGPAEFAADMARFVRDFGVGLVGGCCGTTPDHMAALVRAVEGLPVREREVRAAPAVSSLYLSQPLATSPRPLIIGERTNANGSRRFRDALVADDLERMTAIALDQQKELAHVLDVCVAYAGRDEAQDMARFTAELTTRLELPLMLDTTDPAALEAGLERTAGRAIINSINLEDGGERARRVLALAREHGAAVVGLTIDERGMALTAERKLEVARRLHDLATRGFGLRPGDLLFDPLTFTLASGDPQYRRAGLETLRAVRLLKAEFPESFILLGVSNCSYGLRPELRHVLNSVFLCHALEAGLDAAILHAGRIVPLDRIPERLVALCEDLIFDRRPEGRDPLRALLEAGLAGVEEGAVREAPPAGLSLEERLVRRIVEARADGLDADLEAALERHAPLEIINRFLLEGMRRVGELFGAGRMQLPFVLQAAETMKAAVDHLGPRLPQSASAARGRIVLATVRGDVHDIGKNLAAIILGHNGFEVVDLGTRQTAAQIVAAVREKRPDAVGLSGLLVTSARVMEEDLQTFSGQGIAVPVICGGAALTRRYVEETLRPAYGGEVHYAADAMAGLRIMEEIVSRRGMESVAAVPGGKPAEARGAPSPAEKKGRRPKKGTVPFVAPPFPPPFYGRRLLSGIPLAKVLPFLDQRTLFNVRWSAKGAAEDKAPGSFSRSELEGFLAGLIERAEKERLLDLKAVYGYFRCRSRKESLDVIDDDVRSILESFAFPRANQPPFRSLAGDFRRTGDTVVFQLVTVGAVAAEEGTRLFRASRYRDVLFWHGFCAELAESLAAFIQQEIEREWGLPAAKTQTPRAGIVPRGRLRRLSFGYPGCPGLEAQAGLFRLLRPEEIGVTLSETFALVPEHSTSAFLIRPRRGRRPA